MSVDLLVDLGSSPAGAQSRRDRPDVCAAYPFVSHRATRPPGFEATWDTTREAEGVHNIRGACPQSEPGIGHRRRARCGGGADSGLITVRVPLLQEIVIVYIVIRIWRANHDSVRPSDSELLITVSLASGPKYGYAVMTDIELPVAVRSRPVCYTEPSGRLAGKTARRAGLGAGRQRPIRARRKAPRR